MTSFYKLNESNIQYILSNPAGPVGKDLMRRGRLVERLAKRFVGVDTGALRQSIDSKMTVDIRGLKVRIGSPLPYALMHHNGTRPHEIRSKPGRVLRFPTNGRVVFADRVLHPGTRPNPYLLKALPAAKL